MIVLNKNLDEIFAQEQGVMTSRKKLSKTAIIIIVVACVFAILLTFAFGFLIGRNTGMSDDLPLLIEAYQYIKKYYYKDISWDEFQELGTAAFAGSLDQFSGLVSVDNGTAQSGSFGIYMESTVYNQHRVTFINPNSINYNLFATYRYTEDMQLVEDFVPENEKVMMREGDLIYAIGVNNQIIKVESANSSLMTSILNESEDGIATFIIKKYSPTAGEDGKGGYIDGYYGITMKKSYTDMDKQAFYYDGADFGYAENVGIIKLLEFSSKSNYDFEECINSFVADNKSKLILDLRNNGGGESTSLQFIAQYLIKNPQNTSLPLIKLVSNSGNGNMVENIEYSSTEGGNSPSYYLGNNIEDFEVVVLTNSGSASASEALIGALQFYNDTKIVGTKTFGKGVAQRQFILSNGDVLYVTNGTYYVPTTGADGKLSWDKCIHGVGFTPLEENLVTQFITSYESDACTQRAIQLFS